MHTCSSRKGTQPHRMPNSPRPSAAASHQHEQGLDARVEPRYHARCRTCSTRGALAGHVLTRQNTQSCKYIACSGPQPLTRNSPASETLYLHSGPRGSARSPSETWRSQQGPG
eukprot:5294664-Prymnesium_polylepis.1